MYALLVAQWTPNPPPPPTPLCLPAGTPHPNTALPGNPPLLPTPQCYRVQKGTESQVDVILNKEARVAQWVL